MDVFIKEYLQQINIWNMRIRKKLAHSLGESEVSANIRDWNRLKNLRLLLTHSVPYLIDEYRRLFLLCRIV